MSVISAADFGRWDSMQERLDLRAFDDREMGDLLSEEASAPGEEVDTD
jgi:hypothetical protein